MLRFRLGQRWKREGAARPHDSFGLEVDGIELLLGATEEPLVRVVPALVEALHALALGARPVAQVSMAEANLELALHRRGDEVAVRVVSLARPARLSRQPLRVDLYELVGAGVRVAHALARDLGEAASAQLSSAPVAAMLKRAHELENRPLCPPTPEADAAWSYLQEARAGGAWGFWWTDPEGLLTCFGRRSEAALPSLLAPGEVRIRLAPQVECRVECVPFLLALELSRRAVDLSEALEHGEERFRLLPEDVGQQLVLSVRHSTVRWNDSDYPVDLSQPVRAMFSLGQELAFAATTNNRSQGRNPYLVELVERCREGLAHLRPVRSDPFSPPPRRRATSKAGRPLRKSGSLRRLRLEPEWEKSHEGAEGPNRLLVSTRGVIFSAPVLAAGYSPRGEVLFRRLAVQGVAVAAHGAAVGATLDRLCGYLGKGQARWLRNHTGMQVGPELYCQDGRWIAAAAGRGALAYCGLTGRELWRVEPPRSQRTWLTVCPHRVLLATDSGYLYGLEPADGQVRFRMRAALPFAAPAIAWGRRLVGLISRGDRCAVLAADLQTGTLAWTRELPLAQPAQPITIGQRVLVAGGVDGDQLLVCLGPKGSTLWNRTIPVVQGPVSLRAVGRSVLVSDATGAAVLVSPEGQIEWRLGSAGEPTARPCRALLARGLLLLPGEQVRAVDPRGGRVLGSVWVGAGLCDLACDARLRLYALDETGGLKAFRLGSHLALV